MSADLGRVVSVHRKLWLGIAIAAGAAAVFACAVWLVPARTSDREILSVVCGAMAIVFAGVSRHAWRTCVVVYERGFAWRRERLCDDVAWSDIRGVDGRPHPRSPQWLVVETASGKSLVIPRDLERFEDLHAALAGKRPTAPELPAARVVR